MSAIRLDSSHDKILDEFGRAAGETVFPLESQRHYELGRRGFGEKIKL